MRQRNRQRVGGIRLDSALEIEQHFHHVLNLLLVRMSTPHDSLFYLCGAIFSNLEMCGGPGTDGRASGLPQLDGAGWIAADKDLLDGHLVGVMLGDDLPELFENRLEANRQIFPGQAQAAAGYVRALAAFGIDQCVARNARTGVDADNTPCAATRLC